MIHTCAADSYARKTAGFQLRRPVNSNTPSFTASAFSSVSSPPRTLPWVCSLTPRSLKFLGIVEHYRLQLLLSSPQRAFWGRYPCLSEFATCPLWSGRSISSLVLRTATNARRTAAADRLSSRTGELRCTPYGQRNVLSPMQDSPRCCHARSCRLPRWRRRVHDRRIVPETAGAIRRRSTSRQLRFQKG